MEVLEAVPKPDVVVVCCGGGGLLAGVAAAIKLSGCGETRIYGVEPEGGKSSTVASPPFMRGAAALKNPRCSDWACCDAVFLFKTQLAPCTEASSRRSLWAWMLRASPRDWHLPLQVPFRLFLTHFLFLSPTVYLFVFSAHYINSCNSSF